MNRKLIVHLCIIAALICLAGILWVGGGEPVEAPAAAAPPGQPVEENLFGEVVGEGGKGKVIEEGSKVLSNILLIIVIAGYSAVIFIVYGLPAIVHRFTHMIYDSGEEIEEDEMHDARALLAQGDFEGAIEAYRGVAIEQPENRFPWLEIAKIQHDKLEDVDGSIATLTEALESHEWRVNDAAFFMFRIAELYEKDKKDQATAIGILQQVVEMFPETRHSANATHRLRELHAI
ncbi:MAG: tetratricopeptide repeat protein [Akkermansiaceae bacterium]|nr:tetratricopeptide repeat protein [Akkermansiaceae bacterium]NNM30853.1 tetratricopeptide repeat protein [Akkermansiaceae bacterium]